MQWSLTAQKWLTPLFWLFLWCRILRFPVEINFQWRTHVYNSIFLSSRTPGWEKVNKWTPLLLPAALWPRIRVVVMIEWADGPWLSPLLWSSTADRSVAWLQTNNKRIMILNFVKMCGRACAELWDVWSAVKSQLKIHYRTNSQYSEYNGAVIACQGSEAAVVYASRCVLLKSGGSYCTLGDYL